MEMAIKQSIGLRMLNNQYEKSAHESLAFTTFLQETLPYIVRALTQSLQEPLGSQAQTDLQAYLYQPLAHFTVNGGKLIRPALCILGAHACGYEGMLKDSGRIQKSASDTLLQVSCAFEHFQAAALIHDDIADESLLRRGEPCLYRVHGTGLATNMGDSALVHALECINSLSGISDKLRARLIQEFITMEKHTIEGQALDVGWSNENRWDISLDDYLYMATSKTAYYSASTPLVIGALFADANQERSEALRAYGLQAGLAFQLKDDELNLFGDANKLGKDLRSDIVEGKRTYLTLYALSHLNALQSARLKEILTKPHNSPDELDDACTLIEVSGARKHSHNLARSLAQQADACIDANLFSKETVAILHAMTAFFIQRNA